MIKTAEFILVMIIFSNLAQAQGRKEIFDSDTNITWLGLDFSAAKFMGDDEELGTASDLHEWMRKWNNLLINEIEKYDVGRALYRRSLTSALTFAIDHNDRLNVKNAVDDGAKLLRLNKEDISQIMASYDFGLETGVGIIFVVESFSKRDDKGVFWVTFVNMGSKEVVFTERLIGRPSGFGLRNYWAGSVAHVLKQIKFNYDKWKKG